MTVATRPAPSPLSSRTATGQTGAATLDRLMREHGDALLAYVLRWTQDRQFAEDVVQETWLRAWRHLPRMTEDHGSVRGWLNRVAHNIVVDRYRARQARPGEVELDEGTDTESHTADGAMERVLNAAVLRRALAATSPPVRQTIVEVYLRDRSVAETARRMGVPVGTVKSRLHYGLRELRLSTSDLAA